MGHPEGGGTLPRAPDAGESSDLAPRPRAARAISEMALGLGALAALNAGLAPHDPGLAHTSPHPLFALAAILALRHGSRAGAALGLVSALVHAGAQLLAGERAGLDAPAALSSIAPLTPLLLAATGLACGAIHDRTLARETDLRRDLEAARAHSLRLATRFALAEQAREALERRLVEPAAGLAILGDALRRFAALEEDALYAALAELVADHLAAPGVAVYTLDGGRLRRRAFHGTDARPPDDPDPGHGLFRVALAERRPASIRDALVPGAVPPPDQRPLLVAPLFLDDGAAIGAIAVEAMPLISLTAGAERTLGLIAALAARDLARVRELRALREKGIVDEAGILRYGHFTDRIGQEFARARRHGTPLAVVVVEVLGWEDVPPEGRDPLRRALAEALRSTLRSIDAVYAGREDRVLILTLPHAEKTGAEIARDRISLAVDRLGIEPYRRRGPLEIAIGVAAISSSFARPQDLVDAAREAAVSIPARAEGPTPPGGTPVAPDPSAADTATLTDGQVEPREGT